MLINFGFKLLHCRSFGSRCKARCLSYRRLEFFSFCSTCNRGEKTRLSAQSTGIPKTRPMLLVFALPNPLLRLLPLHCFITTCTDPLIRTSEPTSIPLFPCFHPCRYRCCPKRSCSFAACQLC